MAKLEGKGVRPAIVKDEGVEAPTPSPMTKDVLAGPARPGALNVCERNNSGTLPSDAVA